jgi:PhzF family phenazine biosynthesis protein
MFDGPVEDPATGSAGSALASYLASGKGDGEKRYRIVQGVEMGRKSVVDVGITVEAGKVEAVTLEGEAVVVMEGGYVKVPSANL